MEGATVVDFFSEECLVDALKGLSIEEQQSAIASLSFSRFLRHPVVQDWCVRTTIRPGMPALRLTYNYFLFMKVGEFLGQDEVCEFFVHHVFGGRRHTDLGVVYDACVAMDPHARHAICALVEKATRHQSSNPLWDALRDGIISSSKFHWAVKQQNASRKIFNPCPIANNHFVAGPLAFGLRCEDVVKKLLTVLIHPGEPSCMHYGFMQSPHNGIFGVSLDFAVNVRTDADDCLQFDPDCRVYEIKCRFKYTFSKNEFDPIYQAYQQLYGKPNKQTLKSFFYSIQKPAVEYVGNGKLPSESDYLVAYDREWEVCHRKKRKLTSVYQFVKECMLHNSTAESDVYVLTDPQNSQGKISIKAHFKANLFVNVRHSYFYQVLLQGSIVQEYISLDRGTKTLGTQKNYLATGFFRKRSFQDPVDCTIGEFTRLDPHVEIPTLLILTPVYFPRGTRHHLLHQAAEFWTKSAGGAFPLIPWDFSYLSANVPPSP
ncbi:deoxyribonuclease [Colobine gammaherpesvirus 1]|uniref:Deoxyribonuclease n=1 Tax=Colobine gammaherpesvirus 1 TaxID=2597325 RepID=A0A5B8G7C3_9GAMA|nr:deoxyribonuclease [Colobine gammaherpesvirus 1]QDQ69245.1 deoxyribonuclease [Colobine gammaherpesvirus 1]